MLTRWLPVVKKADAVSPRPTALNYNAMYYIYRQKQENRHFAYL